jgi:phage-related protein
VSKKIYVPVKQVREFIDEQPETVRIEYLNIVDRLEKDGRLVEPYGKKLKENLFEIRVRRGANVRVFYFYFEDDLIFGVHAFVKKSQQTPQQEIKKAEKTISLIRRDEYHE